MHLMADTVLQHADLKELHSLVEGLGPLLTAEEASRLLGYFSRLFPFFFLSL
jgi:hypothetical protein